MSGDGVSIMRQIRKEVERKFRQESTMRQMVSVASKERAEVQEAAAWLEVIDFVRANAAPEQVEVMECRLQNESYKATSSTLHISPSRYYAGYWEALNLGAIYAAGKGLIKLDGSEPE